MVYVHDPFAVAPMAWRWGFGNGMWGSSRPCGVAWYLARSPIGARSIMCGIPAAAAARALGAWAEDRRARFGVWGAGGAGLHGAAAVGKNVQKIETLVEQGGLTWM